ncbi:hypothetical protein ES703_43742 [subsurface metagenome]
MRLCGFLFLLIIVLSVSFQAFGNKIISDLDSGAKLQNINDDPNKFKISIVLALMEHFSIIALVVMLFIVFSPYNLILGVVWTIFRIGEVLILFYNEKNYWGLLNIARQYSGTSGAEKNSLSDLALTILKTKEFRFTFAQILFSIGTIAYSILFVTYEVVPPIIGWLGIVASILFGFGSGIILVKPNFKVPGYFGGFLVMLFEVVLGGWLLFFSHIIP